MRRMIVIGTILSLLLQSTTAFAQESINDTVQRVRAKYPERVTGAQMGAILNEIAWLHRAEGWGLLGKSGGNNCPQPTTDIKVSCDFLVNLNTNRGWDAFSGADSTGDLMKPWNPAISGDGMDFTNDFSTGNRTKVVPVDPGTGAVDPGNGGNPPVSGITQESLDKAVAAALAEAKAYADAGDKKVNDRIDGLLDKFNKQFEQAGGMSLLNKILIMLGIGGAAAAGVSVAK